jgi:hypothetical protein
MYLPRIARSYAQSSSRRYLCRLSAKFVAASRNRLTPVSPRQIMPHRPKQRGESTFRVRGRVCFIHECL